jgi:copper chaperone CopZ
MQQVTLKIDGMSCGHCLNAVSQALRSADGVDEVRTVEMGRAEVVIDESRTTAERVAAAVDAAGYPAHPVTPG